MKSARDLSGSNLPGNLPGNLVNFDKPKITAKTAQRQTAVKPGKYQCQRCQTNFRYSSALLQCPKCGTKTADNLLLVYTEESPENEMLTPEDFSAGD